MVLSLAALMKESLDYSELLSAPKIPMLEAVSSYCSFAEALPEGALGRFVCPTTRLAELAKVLKEAEAAETPMPISVVGRSGHNRAEWETGLEKDSEEMNRFEEAVGDSAEIAAFEIRVPDFNHTMSYANDLSGFSEVDLFLEFPHGNNLGGALAEIVECDWAMVKTSLEPGKGMSSSELAFFLHECVSLELPFKIAGGLESLFRAADSRTTGIVNVLVGAALAISEDLSQREIEKVLTEDSAANFVFEDAQLSWHGFVATAADIVMTRELFVSVGAGSVGGIVEQLSASDR